MAKLTAGLAGTWLLGRSSTLSAASVALLILLAALAMAAAAVAAALAVKTPPQVLRLALRAVALARSVMGLTLALTLFCLLRCLSLGADFKAFVYSALRWSTVSASTPTLRQASKVK
jgi:hypothetical protein